MTAARQVDWEHHVDVIDMIAELVDRHRHREHYTRDLTAGLGYRLGQDHVVDAPPLLQQLEAATPSPAGDTEAAAGGGFKSQPAAHVESIDTLILVDREASRWVREWKIDDAGLTTLDCVRKVGALMPRMDRCHRHKPARRGDGTVACCTWHAAEADVRRWWVQARIVAGWDSPAWRPDATCPMCDQRGTLRVRLSAKAAVCVECRDTWDPSTISHLADHIRAETFTVRAAGRVEPCWCPWPSPIDRMGALCARCGSARCHRAVAAVMGAT